MNIYQTLKERGRAASDYYAGRREYFDLTPASRLLLEDLTPLVKRYARGRLLDAGAGRCAYRFLLKPACDEYVACDIDPKNEDVIAADLQRLPFPDNSFDTVFCSQVLEHVPDHAQAVAECHRVLRPGGHFIGSVPHISWLHNEPHDYFRFTAHGLRYLANRAGFGELLIAPCGGLVSLLGHVLSTLLVNLSFGVPLLHPVVRALNTGLVAVETAFDRRLDRKKLFALNYVGVWRKL